jgi:hypothetical protein
MPDFRESWVALVAISDSVVESNDETDFYFVRHDLTMWPDWYLTLLTEIHALVRTSVIRYATSSITSASDPQGEVMLFTDKLVVKAAVKSNSDQRSRPVVEVTAWRRSELGDITINQVDTYPVSDDRFARPWPRWMSITLTYADRSPVVLPLSTRPSRDARSTLVDVYGSFVDDLVS